jgi:hypothetical protein
MPRSRVMMLDSPIIAIKSESICVCGPSGAHPPKKRTKLEPSISEDYMLVEHVS